MMASLRVTTQMLMGKAVPGLQFHAGVESRTGSLVHLRVRTILLNLSMARSLKEQGSDEPVARCKGQTYPASMHCNASWFNAL